MSAGKDFTLIANGRLLQAVVCLLVIGLIVLSTAVPAMTANGDKAKADDRQAREDYAYSAGLQAYLYGLAPVIMERSEKIGTTTPGRGHAPVNRFGHIRSLATPNDTWVVTPNSDTLYSSAWLELGKEPLVLHVPDTQGRYYVMQMLDAYTNTFANVGRRTTGTSAGDFAIVGPGWNGSIPGSMKVIRSPTNTVWIIGRFLVNGPGDVANVTALQDQLSLVPLSQYGNPSAVAGTGDYADYKTYLPSTDVVGNLTFFEELRVALKNNPPPAGEAGLMAIFDNIGLGANETPYGSGLDPAVAAGLSRALKDGDNIVKVALANTKGKTVNGWSVMTDIGTYGYDYLTRAAVAEAGLGANVPQESIYPKTTVDSSGELLSGAHRYTMHFAPGQTPPVDAFWSLTSYNATTYMLVPNPIHRYSIGDRTAGLRYNADGSLDIYIQPDMPAGNETNWLPVPEGDFNLVLRMYQPKPEALNGTYQIPPVKRVS